MEYPDINQYEKNDRLWEAKMLLQGRLSSKNFDPELMRIYGELLLRMGDKIEAGRYLFCSGSRNEEYKEAISLFLERNSRNLPNQFISALPSMARRHANVREIITTDQFERFGYTNQQIAEIISELKTKSKEIKPISLIKNIIFFSILIFIIICLLIGVITIVNGIYKGIRGENEQEKCERLVCRNTNFRKE